MIVQAGVIMADAGSTIVGAGDLPAAAAVGPWVEGCSSKGRETLGAADTGSLGGIASVTRALTHSVAHPPTHSLAHFGTLFFKCRFSSRSQLVPGWISCRTIWLMVFAVNFHYLLMRRNVHAVLVFAILV